MQVISKDIMQEKILSLGEQNYSKQPHLRDPPVTSQTADMQTVLLTSHNHNKRNIFTLRNYVQTKVSSREFTTESR